MARLVLANHALASRSATSTSFVSPRGSQVRVGLNFGHDLEGLVRTEQLSNNSPSINRAGRVVRHQCLNALKLLAGLPQHSSAGKNQSQVVAVGRFVERAALRQDLIQTAVLAELVLANRLGPVHRHLLARQQIAVALQVDAGREVVGVQFLRPTRSRAWPRSTGHFVGA